jgi:hypothetical protein
VINLADCTRRMEAAVADGCDINEARTIAAEVRAQGHDREADLLLMIYGERSRVALDGLLAEVVR